MASYEPCDERFAADGWTDTTIDPRFAQRRLRGEKRIYCETVTRLRVERDRLVDKLRGPWTWWTLGRTTGFRVNADGSTQQLVAPIWWYVARVGCHVLPPEPAPESGVRLRIRVSHHFEGLQTIDVLDAPGGELIMRGRMHGVVNRFPVGGTSLVTTVHLRAESGTLFFPFPKGTGWSGLARA